MSETHSGIRLLLLALLVAGLAGSALLIVEVGPSPSIVVALTLSVALLVTLRPDWAVYLLIFSMLLSPEFAAGLTTKGGTLGRGVTFRFDDLLLALVGLTWFVRSAIYKELGILTRTRLNAAMGLYIVACSVSTLVAIMVGRVQPLSGGLFVLKYTQYFVLFFLVVNCTRTERQLRRFWIAVALTAVIVATIGITYIPSGQRITAPFEGDYPEPNTLGGYLAFVILICLALFFGLNRTRAGWVYLAVAILLLTPFVFTLSRASYLGFLPGLAVILWINKSRVAAWLVVAGALFLLLAPEVVPRSVRERVSYTWSQPPRAGQTVVLGRRLDTSTSARLASFAEALNDFPQHPFLGFGVTGWHFIDSQYFRTLVETGLVGLTCLLFLFYRIFQLGIERVMQFGRRTFFGSLSAGFLGGFVCLLFHAIGSNTFIIIRIMQPFWLVAALVFVSGRFIDVDLDRTEAEQAPEQADGTPS